MHLLVVIVHVLGLFGVFEGAVQGNGGNYNNGYKNRNQDDLASPHRRFIEVPHCKQKSEACFGFPQCCDKLHCFWEGGINPFKSGICVSCIDRGQKCQKDSQCCEPLACHKSSHYQVDGQCDSKLPDGQECHDDDQCRSNYCLIGWLEFVKGQGGKCSTRQ